MCRQHCYKARRVGASAATIAPGKPASTGAKSLPASSGQLLTGTWDFKWFAGSTIRIAFQELRADAPPSLDFARGLALVEEKLELWFGGAAGVPKPSLRYEILPERLPPPREPGSAKSHISHMTPYIEYDILISLSPLPLILPETEQHPESPVSTSASELGRYALRAEYGVPTMYLGPPPGRDVSEWFGALEGEFTVAHELGHMLGLPHEQQNPRLDHAKLQWKKPDDMLKIIERKGGFEPRLNIEEFIATEIKGPWPGGTKFSDWRSPPPIPDVPAKLDFDSVMTKPSIYCLFERHHDCVHDAPEGAGQPCKVEQDGLRKLRGPTKSDLQHLAAMYPQESSRGQRPRPGADLKDTRAGAPG